MSTYFNEIFNLGSDINIKSILSDKGKTYFIR